MQILKHQSFKSRGSIYLDVLLSLSTLVYITQHHIFLVNTSHPIFLLFPLQHSFCFEH